MPLKYKEVLTGSSLENTSEIIRSKAKLAISYSTYVANDWLNVANETFPKKGNFISFWLKK